MQIATLANEMFIHMSLSYFQKKTTLHFSSTLLRHYILKHLKKYYLKHSINWRPTRWFLSFIKKISPIL